MADRSSILSMDSRTHSQVLDPILTLTSFSQYSNTEQHPQEVVTIGLWQAGTLLKTELLSSPPSSKLRLPIQSMASWTTHLQITGSSLEMTPTPANRPLSLFQSPIPDSSLGPLSLSKFIKFLTATSTHPMDKSHTLIWLSPPRVDLRHPAGPPALNRKSARNPLPLRVLQLSQSLSKLFLM